MSRNHVTPLAALAITIAAALASSQAQAVQRTHVSAAFGSDANTATNCTAAAPCRFFTAAMTVTDTNGEVIVLDSGGYGAVTITQSVSLIAPAGVYAGISVFPGGASAGVTIATAGVNVVLRGITINGQGGNDGISMTAGNSLAVENCVISNVARNGISISGGGRLAVEKSVVANVLGSGIVAESPVTVRITETIVRDSKDFGIWLLDGVKGAITRTISSGNRLDGVRVEGFGAGTTTVADVADSTIDGNGVGVNATSANATAVVKVSVRDTRAVRNVNSGIIAFSGAGAAVSLSASNNIASNNGFGMTASGAGSKIAAIGNTLTDNGTGAAVFSALFESAGNNLIRNNTTNISGALTVVSAN